MCALNRPKNRYNLKDMTWQTIVDTVVVGAMGPPGGGRNHITPRLLRHFNILCFLEFDDGTLTRIFKTIVDWHFNLNKVRVRQKLTVSSLSGSSGEMLVLDQLALCEGSS